MTTKAFYHQLGIEVDFADLPLWLYKELASLHGQMDRDKAILTCLGNGEPMYVYRHQSGRYFARHYPDGSGESHSHGYFVTMSDEHRRQAEYSRRAAEVNGFTAQLEVSTGGNTRVDVGVYSELGNVGLEIQRSALTIPQAKSRAAKSFGAGWATAWVSDRELDPAWMDRVPTARLTTRGGWNERVLPANTAQVVISTFRRERDPSKKSGWRYEREPKTVLLDELAYLMPAGEIVPVVVGRGGHVVLADRGAREVIDSCTYPGASRWDPLKERRAAVKEAAQSYSRDCHHVEQRQTVVVDQPRYTPPIMLRPLREPPVTRAPIAPVVLPEWPRCGCGERLLAPVSVSRGYCERCRIDRGAVRGAPTKSGEDAKNA